jgi:hypothetical protein
MIEVASQTQGIELGELFVNHPAHRSRTHDRLPTITRFEDSIMEATLCQVVDANVAEIAAEHAAEQSITTLTSVEMSFAGGGLLVVAFG